jgi:hypothetical protein
MLYNIVLYDEMGVINMARNKNVFICQECGYEAPNGLENVQDVALGIVW